MAWLTLAKSATDSKMRSLLVRSFLSSCKFEQKSNLLVQILTFLLETVALVEVRGFKLVMADSHQYLLACVEAYPSPDQHHWEWGLKLVWGAS